jgi:hypothetical protein
LERRRKEKKLLLFLPIDYCSVSSFASAGLVFFFHK